MLNHVGDGYEPAYLLPWPTSSEPNSLYGVLGDFNGDGKPDIRNPLPAAPSGCPECAPAYSDSVVPDLMVQHKLSMGGTVDVQYLPSTYWSHGYLPTVLQVVSKITTSDGRGNSSAVKYGYDGGLYDAAERKFLGFETVVTKLPCNVEDTSPDCPWLRATYEQHPAAVGAIKQLDIYEVVDGADVKKRRIAGTYPIC